MCNCGDKRSQLVLSSGHAAAAGTGIWSDIWFEYTGRSALTVKGFITGRTYRFSTPGAVLLVDYRDASKMLLVPSLKRK
ncbi:hypothetical protein LL912_20490 [Niabella sp. CC-SYL272]|uniref:hypothetical protein n=1 Tax=Niabella agricola TaxID=2891571 RepID=UPI001F3DB169|nr:hypothetical protein [Niabella agricola]MCF3111179.1 hypothetical protein [Niabella agricola]